VPRDALTPFLQSNPLALYGLACVFAPVLEETMFRGALFHYLRGRWGWAASAVTVSFVFAVIHPQGWIAVPALGAIALALAALREWRGSIIASMVAHSFNNFLAVTFALLLLRNS
jgi:membrane protease YdiL (CAAX protease family)